MSQALLLQQVIGLAGSGGKHCVPDSLSPTPQDPVDASLQLASTLKAVISHRSQHWTPSTGETEAPSQHLIPAPLHCTGVVLQMFSMQDKPFLHTPA